MKTYKITKDQLIKLEAAVMMAQNYMFDMGSVAAQNDIDTVEDSKEILQWFQVEEIADDALNVLCGYVQDRLGVKNGDLASMFWTGDNEKTIQTYISSELKWKADAKGNK